LVRFLIYLFSYFYIYFIGFGAEIDEFELENELAQLEQEALSQEMAQINLPTVPAHSVPSYAQPAAASSSKAAKNDQLAELERWAS
jgi:ribosomal protein L12E/L44/L45/RPP1/RPP2